MTITKRSQLGRPLTWDELDANFEEVQSLVSQSTEAVNAATAQAQAASQAASQAAFAQSSAQESAATAVNAAQGAGQAAADAVEGVATSLTNFQTGLAANDGEKFIGVCPDIAILRTTEPVANSQRITLRQHTSGMGTGGGQFRALLSGSGYTDDNGTIIKTMGGAVWLRVGIETINPLMFGADPTGINDSTAAFQAAIDAVYARGGGEVYVPGTNGNGAGNNAGYKISASIQVKPFVNLRGDGFSSCLRTTQTLSKGIFQLINHAGIGGRYIQNIRLLGNGSGAGIGTNIEATDTTPKYIYGWKFDGLIAENFEYGYQMQGLWHSTFSNCTSSVCRVGLYLWGQDVSVLINGCHFRRDGRAIANTRGIEIQRRTYAWSSDQNYGSQSESIIIDGATMSIGNEYALLIDGGLDVQVSHFTMDFCGKGAIRVVQLNGSFSVTDSWIAADDTQTNPFVAIDFVSGDYLSTYVKNISNTIIRCSNAKQSGTNIGIQAGSGAQYLHLDSLDIGGGDASVFYSGTSESSISNCKLTTPVFYRNGCQKITVRNSFLSGIDESGKTSGTFNTYISNTGTPATNGMMRIDFASNASTASAAIPSGSDSLQYLANKWDANDAGKGDLVSVSGTTINVNRPTPVTDAIPCFVEYRAV